MNHKDNHICEAPLSMEEIKKISIHILDVLDTFCKENEIKYTLAGGTLLGAIRHNGFIPWDDDIDIILPRADYERLIATFNDSSNDVRIMDYKNTQNYCWPFAKAISTSTVLIENGMKNYPLGVFVDLFPLDEVYGDESTAIKAVKKITFWKNILTLKHLRIEKHRTLWKNVVVGLGKLLIVIPDKYLIKKINNLATSYQGKDCKYKCSFMGAWGIKEIFNKDFIGEPSLHLFEGDFYNIPEDFDYYLSSLYGNYLKLPPVEKRVTHHDYEAYWKTSKEDMQYDN